MAEGVAPEAAEAERRRGFPGITIAITAACVVVYMYQVTLTGSDFDQYQIEHGFIPKQIWDWFSDPGGLAEPLTLLTYPFLHKSELHVLSNLFFLWLFVMVCGKNLEAALGHIGFFLVCLASVLVGAALQIALYPDSITAVVGLSGLVSGVLGAAFVLRPKANAAVVALWLAFSLVADVSGLNLEFFVHLGGLVAGALVALAFRPPVAREAALGTD